MKKPTLDLKAGQLWEGAFRDGPRTRRRIAAADKIGVLWYRPDEPILAFFSTRKNFEKWAERLLP
jgi:hypothetical protein